MQRSSGHATPKYAALVYYFVLKHHRSFLWAPLICLKTDPTKEFSFHKFHPSLQKFYQPEKMGSSQERRLEVQPTSWQMLSQTLTPPISFSKSPIAFPQIIYFPLSSLHSPSLPLLRQYVVVQSLSCVWPFAIPWTAARQTSLSLTVSRSLPEFMSIVSVMPSSCLILQYSLLLRPSIFPTNLGLRDFPGGPVVKNLPANAGATGSILGSGRSHMLQGN